jgi:hypothetical protein
VLIYAILALDNDRAVSALCSVHGDTFQTEVIMGVIKEYEGLAKVTDINEGDLANISKHIQEYIETENNNVLQVIANDLKACPRLIGVLFLYQIYQRSIDHEIESYFDIFDKIVNGYQEAMKLKFDEAQWKLEQ